MRHADLLAGQLLTGVAAVSVPTLAIEADALVLTVTGTESVVWKGSGRELSQVFLQEQAVVNGLPVSGVLEPGEYDFQLSFQLPSYLPGSCWMPSSRITNADVDVVIGYSVTLSLRLKDGEDIAASENFCIHAQPLPLASQERELRRSASPSVVLLWFVDRGSLEITGVLERNWFSARDYIRVHCTLRNTSASDIRSLRIALVRDMELRSLDEADGSDRKSVYTVVYDTFPGVAAGREAQLELVL